MKETWFFTFGIDHPLKKKMQPIEGAYGQAREKMFELYGTKWCGQYSHDQARDLASKYSYSLLPTVEDDV